MIPVLLRADPPRAPTRRTQSPLMNDHIKVEASHGEPTTSMSGRTQKKSAISREASRQEFLEEEEEEIERGPRKKLKRR